MLDVKKLLSHICSETIYKKGDVVSLYNCKAFGRLTNARNQAFVSICLPKPIANGVSATVTITSGYCYTGTTSVSVANRTVTVDHISNALGQVVIVVSLPSTMSAIGVAVLDQISGTITFN